MKTREWDWFDLAADRTMYGFQVRVDGKWCNTHDNGKPCIYATKAERDKVRAEFRNGGGVVSMKLSDIAAKIHAHLKRFEADPDINAVVVSTNHRGQESRLKSYYYAGAGASGRYVYVCYIAYQGNTHLTKADALRYLEWLDAGNVGRHFEAFREAKGQP